MKHVNLVPCGGWRMRSVGPGLVALALAAMAVAAPVHAADLPVAPAYNPPTPIPPAIYNWTGFYLGGNIGAGLLAETMTPTGAAAAGLTPGVPFHPSIVGLVGGAQAGVDYQFSSIVVGAQATLSDSYLNGQNTQNTVGGVSQLRMTSEPTWFASVTGRVGVAANTLLFYVKGGGAWMHIEHVQDVLTGGATVATQAISDDRSGFVAGVGLEYAMTENLSALFEYDFYDFGTKTENFNPAVVGTPVAIRSDLHTLVLGLNYRFNWGSVGEPFCPTC
jgi:outer membrane immunogenic protein